MPPRVLCSVLTCVGFFLARPAFADIQISSNGSLAARSETCKTDSTISLKITKVADFSFIVNPTSFNQFGWRINKFSGLKFRQNQSFIISGTRAKDITDVGMNSVYFGGCISSIHLVGSVYMMAAPTPASPADLRDNNQRQRVNFLYPSETPDGNPTDLELKRVKHGAIILKCNKSVCTPIVLINKPVLAINFHKAPDNLSGTLSVLEATENSEAMIINADISL